MVNILGAGERGRGPLQLDIGIVVSGLGGNSNEERSQLNGLVSFFGVDFGLYIGPSYNPFRTVGPSIGIGVVIGSNGFLAAKLGVHFRRAFGLAMLFPIVPIYGVTGAGFLAALPVSEGVKAAATVPLLLVPAAAVYREDIHKMRIRGMDALMKLKSYIRGK
ncbi:hypothetical protein [Methanosarcina mazei]|uniref:Uncharacterized protein n=3 Tax=Methanosarcina mazei TaxID=2209 RepID=A0A0F8N7T5_METMZ|nr:hypothetical protein [Methanosarcina mazei]AGF98103.1 Hypothetical protein MmTuc01_2823 [Methanosarcina mazei Tuc01]AKB61828.1 hypothetical protein MSMAP_1843 [Methanosarcina mazei SarPi]KKG12675.1 hypothetical protein DU34_20320 [Methanosarcina mazei]KKG28614.1 hypothetical protein DU49_07715 [Methanosarcina mazei]KKG29777.1 hypothetical protein DU52_19925 [Methanosarcina mazei]